MSRLVLAIQVDALRHDYPCQGAPFLQSIIEGGVSGPLRPTFGFEPDFAYLAGLHPDEADGGAQFWRSPETSPFGFVRWLPRWLDSMPSLPSKVLRKGVAAVARRRSRAPLLSAAMIPFSVLPDFDLVIRCGQDEPGACVEPTVFDLLRESGRAWLTHWAPEWPVDVDSAVDRVTRELVPPISFAFAHVGNLDRIGHRFGPESPELLAETSRVDAGLRRIDEVCRTRFDEVHLVVFGDHGMATVERGVDVAGAMTRLPWRQGRDYHMFLDSTMARFWFANPGSRAAVEEALSRLRGGRLLGMDDRDRYHLNYGHNRFGDAIFLAEPGWIVSPNFYQRGALIRGMHGYAPECIEQHSWFGIKSLRVACGRVDRCAQDMRRVFPTLVELLGLELPVARRSLRSLL